MNTSAPAQFTVMLWVKMNADCPSQFHDVWSRGGHYSLAPTWGSYPLVSRVPLILFQQGDNWQNKSGSATEFVACHATEAWFSSCNNAFTSPARGAWTHYAFVVDGFHSRIFVNGTLDPVSAGSVKPEITQFIPAATVTPGLGLGDGSQYMWGAQGESEETSGSCTGFLATVACRCPNSFDVPIVLWSNDVLGPSEILESMAAYPAVALDNQR